MLFDFPPLTIASDERDEFLSGFSRSLLHFLLPVSFHSSVDGTQIGPNFERAVRRGNCGNVIDTKKEEDR